MLSKKEVIEKIFNEIEEESNHRLKVIDKVFGNGYYIFEFGEDSVCNFKIKGLKRWTFGLWIRKDNDNESYVINLFGEHNDYIDKFKPTATRITHEIKYVDENDLWKCQEFVDELLMIKHHPSVMKHWYYGMYENYLIFLLREFFYYRIESPLTKFKEYSLTKIYLNIIKIFYKLRFRKLDVNVYVKEKGWYPPFNFQLYYDKYDEDEVEDIYFSIENENRKVWLIPEWIRNNIDVEHFRDKDDTRGFYYINE